MKLYKKSIILFSLITLIFLLCASNVFAQRGRLKAFVKDEQGNPIKDAIVIAENPLSMSGKVEVKTDKDGKFVFKVPDTGVWTVDRKSVV